MYSRRFFFARIRAVLALAALLVLDWACAPAATQVSPSVEVATDAVAIISPDNMVFPAQVAVEQNQQMIQAFLNVSPSVRTSLSEAVLARNAANASSFGEPALNFDGGNAVYARDANQELQLQVIGVPVFWTTDMAAQIETMMAAGATEDLVLGTMHVENDIESGPQKGDYLFIWQAASNNVVMQNIATGFVEQSDECYTNQNDIFNPSFEFSQGSLGICIPWDKRKCCF